jgi:hypothetical protein
MPTDHHTSRQCIYFGEYFHILMTYSWSRGEHINKLELTLFLLGSKAQREADFAPKSRARAKHNVEAITKSATATRVI